MTWARWNPGRWHRIERRYQNVREKDHPYAEIVTSCGKWMREPDAESDGKPPQNVCPRCAGRAELDSRQAGGPGPL